MSEGAGPAIEARGIARSYGPVQAVAELTFSAGPGEVLGFLGPNGAGKTTAIRVLTTILAPTHGEFAVAGVPHTRPAEIRRRIGVLPESAGYPDGQTGQEYLRYHARLFGHSRRHARALADRLLADVGLDERGSALVGAYSRGMRQRLGIARALVNDPRVVFLDEPTLGLDPAGQLRMLDLVRGIARQRGATVLLSTHLLNEVEAICSRVLILNRGRVVAEGSVAEIAGRAAAARRGWIQVPPEHLAEAISALGRLSVRHSAEEPGERPGWLRIDLAPGEDAVAMNRAVGALVASGVPILAFELEGSRLSDAFLAMTEGG